MAILEIEIDADLVFNETTDNMSDNEIITELKDIQRFGNLDSLCSYVGLVPRTNSSGENEKIGEITPHSNRQLRSMLVESSWIAIRQDAALMMRYSDLCQRMEPNKAIIKIAKKLLSRIKYVLKNKALL